MRVSYSWLKELVQVNEAIETLSERLSIAGFEVESVEDLAANAKGVVVGYVLQCKPHPDAEKLSICNVDVGKDKKLQIVCGAKNIKEHIHVPVALLGANLNAIGLKIKKSNLRGVKSEGMICSLSEIGLANDADGIAVLEDLGLEKIVIGESISKTLGLDDYILELAITANRSDGMSMVGIAREVAALTGSTLTLPEITNKLKINDLNQPTFEDAVPSGFDIYGLTLLTIDNNLISSPRWLSDRLERAGIRSINTTVDITNYVMLEQGQPHHAFDVDALEKLTGDKVTHESFLVKQAVEGEEFTSIEGKSIKLTKDTQVVSCNGKVVSVAGVIGGEDSCVTTSTKRILLESAVFKPTCVRKTSRSIGLRTESSSRYEKGLPTEITKHSARRCIQLLDELLEAKESGSWFYCKSDNKSKSIHLRRNAIHKLLGPLSVDDNDIKNNTKDTCNQLIESQFLKDKVIVKTLEALGCCLNNIEDGWDVKIPPSRNTDLKREVDLIEEVARLVGYDRFLSRLPNPIAPGQLNATQKAERLLRQHLIGAGLQEITTMSLVGIENSDNERIAISNPLLVETSHLRTTMMHEHLKICKRNIQAFLPGCWIFEIGKLYSRCGYKISERNVLAGAISGDRTIEQWSSSGKPKLLNFYEARGQLDIVFQSLKLKVIDAALTDNQFLHKGRASELSVEGKPIGYFGQVHPSIAEEHNLSRITYLFELDLASIIEASTRSSKWIPTFKPYSSYPSIQRDISVIISRDFTTKAIVNSITKTGKPLLDNVQLIDKYESDQIGTNKWSLAFRLTYKSQHKTLTDSDIENIHEKIRGVLANQYLCELRS